MIETILIVCLVFASGSARAEGYTMADFSQFPEPRK
jgi:hypothetical protein